MLEFILVVTITLIIGPISFYIISNTLYKNKPYKKYPVGPADKYGDVLFLPLFNAFAFENIIFSLNMFILSSILSIIITTIFFIYNKNINEHDDWSRPGKYNFNFGGYYHLSYFFLQSIVIFYSLLIFYNIIALWITIIGYLITFIWHGYLNITKKIE